MNNAATVAAVGGLWRLCDWKKAVAIKKKTNEWILVGVVTLIGFALFAIAMMFVNGAFVVEAQRAGWDAVGIDLNRGLVDASLTYWSLQGLTPPLLPLSLGDFARRERRQWSTITAIQVFEHMQDPVSIGAQLTALCGRAGSSTSMCRTSSSQESGDRIEARHWTPPHTGITSVLPR